MYGKNIENRFWSLNRDFRGFCGMTLLKSPWNLWFGEGNIQGISTQNNKKSL